MAVGARPCITLVAWSERSGFILLELFPPSLPASQNKPEVVNQLFPTLNFAGTLNNHLAISNALKSLAHFPIYSSIDFSQNPSLKDEDIANLLIYSKLSLSLTALDLSDLSIGQLSTKALVNLLAKASQLKTLRLKNTHFLYPTEFLELFSQSIPSTSPINKMVSTALRSAASPDTHTGG